MKVLYFSWIREGLGISEETVIPNGDVNTVQSLVEWMIEREPKYREIFSDLSGIRVAVNQHYVTLSHPLNMNDEVAFFPPVTGGSFTGSEKW